MFSELYPFGSGFDFDNDINEPDCNEVNSDLVIPDSFAQAMSYEQQIAFLYNLLKSLSASATVDDGVGTPAVYVTEDGSDDNIHLSFYFHNLKGEPGESGSPGQPGQDGEDGFSPTVSISSITGGHRITITDEDGDHTFDVMDGSQGEQGVPGQDGSDGFSPTVSVTDITGGHQVTITDADGAHTFNVMNGLNGQDGSDGADGFSPEVTISSITGGHRVTITDEDHPSGQSFDVMDGQDGQAIPPVITAQATVDSSTGTPSVTVTKSGTDEAPTYTFAFHNLKGANGSDGQDGSDGISPTVTVRSITGGHQIEIVSAGGTERFDVMDGTDGSDGTDGVSPTVTVRSITGGHQIEIVSAGGTERFDVMDGVDGTNGSDGTDGVSPTVSTTAITDGTRVTITDAQGSHTFDVMNGTDGTDGSDGSDGISPTVTVRSITGGHQIEIVSAGGTEQFDVMDGTDGTDGSDGAAATIQVGTVTTGAAGTNASVTNSGTSSAAVFDFTIPRGADGQNGQTGPAGPGVASGGTAGQILAKASGTDYDTEWINPPSSGGNTKGLIRINSGSGGRLDFTSGSVYSSTFSSLVPDSEIASIRASSSDLLLSVEVVENGIWDNQPVLVLKVAGKGSNGGFSSASTDFYVNDATNGTNTFTKYVSYSLATYFNDSDSVWDSSLASIRTALMGGTDYNVLFEFNVVPILDYGATAPKRFDLTTFSGTLSYDSANQRFVFSTYGTFTKFDDGNFEMMSTYKY